MKKTITVPPKEERCVNGRWYRAGEKYEIEVADKKPKGIDSGEKTISKS